MYKVKQSDLEGRIKDFPIEVVQKMVEEQVHQGNKADVGVFQIDPSFCVKSGGFDWVRTKEGDEFWHSVIDNVNFDMFFAKYQKKSDKISSGSNTEEDMLIKGIEDCINKNRVIPIKLVTEYNGIIEGKK